MADDRKAAGVGCLKHTLHVWPAREVIAQSAYWPTGWHLAYERAARQLGERVACCVLGGLPICPEPISMEMLPAGRLTFSVHVCGTSIDIVILAFEGPDGPEPDAPGPRGGVRRSTVDGLVLGLRGTGKSFTIATFYDGPVPSIPAGHLMELRVGSPRWGASMWGGRNGGKLRWRASRLPSLDAGVSWATPSPMAPHQAMAGENVRHTSPTSLNAAGTCERFRIGQRAFRAQPDATAKTQGPNWTEINYKQLRPFLALDGPGPQRCYPERAFEPSDPLSGTTRPRNRQAPPCSGWVSQMLH